jgi:thermostable 8-oxoguanine DNA glycosylase
MNIDPKNITNFSRTDAELQSFWLFSLFVAGKNSDHASACLARLLSKARYNEQNPFDYLRELGDTGIHNALVAARVGQYARLTKAIVQSLDLDLRSASLEDLMNVFGCGPKTARFFLLHSRPQCECAVLDTHILAWMKSKGVDVPPATPTGEKYLELEKTFLFMVKVCFPQMSIAQVDLLIWMKQSNRLDDDFQVSFDKE